MFRRLLLQHPRRGVATGLLALTAFTLGSSDGPSLPTSNPPSDGPFRQFLSSISSIFCKISHFHAQSLLQDSSMDVSCCTGCLGRNSIVKAARAGPAVVNICLTEGIYGPMLVTGIGSGTIIDPDGTILTCAHCIADFASRKTISKGKGNSGGPLINLDGEVVGVNIMKMVAADGLSFAVPIDTVIKIFEQFRKNGRVVRPWLGLSMLDLNEMKILQFKESDASFPDVTKGVLVPLVTPGSPGDRAGFQPGDIVIELGGRPVGEIKEIIDIMEDKVGVPLKVLVKRPNNKTVTLTVVPEEADTDM